MAKNLAMPFLQNYLAPGSLKTSNKKINACAFVLLSCAGRIFSIDKMINATGKMILLTAFKANAYGKKAFSIALVENAYEFEANAAAFIINATGKMLKAIAGEVFSCAFVVNTSYFLPHRHIET
jgi:hypothetical protein